MAQNTISNEINVNFRGRVDVFPDSLSLATIGFLATFHDSTGPPSTECLQMPLPSRVHNG